jgi:hypothetical protein
MSLEKLRREAKYVTLHVGDIIIDLMTGNVGVLLRLERKIDMIEDDIYIWEISWASTPTAPYNVPSSKYMEESSLKLSIVAGLYDRHSIRDSIILPE